MNIKKVLIILILIITLTGCTKVSDLSYDEILNNFAIKEKPANAFRQGYKFYIPKRLSMKNAGINYAVLVNNDTTFYIYFDLISLSESKDIESNFTGNGIYEKNFNYEDKKGYLAINLEENNKYLIEIMYNYAKIELMVDESKIKESLVYAISILKSVKYDMSVVKDLLNSDDLDSTEEVYDMFNDVKKNSNSLDYSVDDDEIEEKIIKDTDYID